MSEKLLELRHVFAVHRTNHGDAAALQGAELELGRGETLCVLGPSGAGKTTLLRVIAGLQPPSAGDVRFLGLDIGRLGPRARAQVRHRYIGAIGQSAAALAPDLSAEQVVDLPLSLRGVDGRDRRARVSELLEVAGLRDRAHSLSAELSGGERQRLALCAALAHAPELLLADEPTGELDRDTADAVHELIGAMARKGGTSVIVATHDEEISRHADRTVTMRDGRIVGELRDGEPSIIVSADGWLHLPPELRDRAGIDARARAHARPGGLTLSPASAAPAPDEPTEVPEPPVISARPATVQLRAVRREYRSGGGTRVVLAALSHSFAPGEVTVITGRSGAGKTTLLRLIAGLDWPDAGEVEIDGIRIDGLDREARAAVRRDRIGYLGQDPALVPFLSTRENVALALRIGGGDGSEGDVALSVDRELAALALAERARQRVARLSAGELQRVGLARALAGARGLLVADEPTSRLDRANAELVAARLAEAAERDGRTVICASHDPALIAVAADILELDARA